MLAKNQRTDRLKVVLSPIEYEYWDLQTLRPSIASRLFSQLSRHVPTSIERNSPERRLARLLLSRTSREDVAFVALDNSISLCRALIAEGFQGPILLVQHGNNNFAYDQQVTEVLDNCILLSWGTREVERYSMAGLRAKYVVPIGSINDYEYRRSQGHRQASQTFSRICVVSEFRDDQDQQHDEYMISRVESWNLILNGVSECAAKLNMETAVALRPSTFGAVSNSAQRRYFLDRLDGRCTFSKHDEPFSSYSLVDSSEVTIGLQSALLTESIGRGNKIIYYNPLSDARLSAPISGLCSYSGLDSEAFVRHVDTVRTSTIDHYIKSLSNDSNYLIRGDLDTSQAIQTAVEMLRRGLEVAEISAVLSLL